MSSLAEYFHKKYYSDLPFEYVQKAVSENESVLGSAMDYMHKNYYPDVDKTELSRKLNNVQVPGNNPFNTNRAYLNKSVDGWDANDYREYAFDLDNGFVDNSYYQNYIQKLNSSPYDQIKSSSKSQYVRNIENAYLDQQLPGVGKVEKGNPFFDKKPSLDKLTPEKMDQLKNFVENNSFKFNESQEWNKLGTTKESAIENAMLVQPKKDYISYLNNPQYVSIAKNFFGDNYLQAIENQKNRLLSSTLLFGDLPPGSYGEANLSNITLSRPGSYPGGLFRFAPSHELSHVTDRGLKDYFYNVDMSKESQSPWDEKIIGSKWSDFISKNSISKDSQDSFTQYLNNPTEVRARVNTIRQHLLKNNIDLNSKDDDIESFINKSMPGDAQYNQLKKVFKKEDIFKAMRELASNKSNNDLQFVS